MRIPKILAAMAVLLVVAGANAQVYVDDYREPYRYVQDRYEPYDRYDDSRYDNHRDSRGRVIRCESDNYRHRSCATGGAHARIVRQISRAACVEGRTWGNDGRGIWVDRGCAAEFALVPRGRGYDNRYNRGYDDRAAYGYGNRDNRRYDDRAAYGYDPRYGNQSYSGGGRQIRCESRKYGREFCRVPGLRAADIVHQISQTRCQFNRNWGYSREGVWVDQGCAAQFVIR